MKKSELDKNKVKECEIRERKTDMSEINDSKVEESN